METQNPSKNQSEEQKIQIQNDNYDKNYQYQALITEEAEYYQVGDKNCINEFELTKEIGQGSFGKIFLSKRHFYDENNVQQQELYAIKQFHRGTLDGYRLCRTDKDKNQKIITWLDLFYEEIQMYQYLDHPNICKLFEVIDSENIEYAYFVLEYCDLGQIQIWDIKSQRYKRNQNVFQYLQNKYEIKEENEQKLVEKICKIIFFQIFKGVQYLHNQRNIANRDIKPDNILCQKQNSDNLQFEDIKLADFSTAVQLEKQNEIVNDCQGTAGIRPPEMQFSTQGYLAKPTDIWSLGICLFIYITEQNAFEGESELELDINAKNQELKFNEKQFSEELIDLIQLMCKKDNKERINIDQALKHSWFQDDVFKEIQK
ncbi:Protein kinase-like domain [Pseudocohnilembus persalinus]|uniref:Protein kinase-like domain n=1 Tax=Pseudocohnilembus persalinus TaxID=266149 RepID=A0A0V0QHL5_PSEPJ|nr:Protein kinase-like domain [Pseudocohnilembus persalinus]|eukprot:KRX01737.1 Protein kinase-like domain [Pseudocohnilembus persalinus]